MKRAIVQTPLDLFAQRRGVVVPLLMFLMVFLVAMVAFGVDIGFITLARTQAQAASDSGSLAGLGVLAKQLEKAPIVGGIPVQTQADLALARAAAKEYAEKNLVGMEQPVVKDSDIEIGFLANPYDQSSDTLDTSGWPARPYNAVRVTVKRDSDHETGPLPLFFAPVIGTTEVDVSATSTAAFVMGSVLPTGNEEPYSGGVLPFTYDLEHWTALLAATSPGVVVLPDGTSMEISDDYAVDSFGDNPTHVQSGADQRLEGSMFPISQTSGNFGTVNFTLGQSGNSTSVLTDLILNGPVASEWPDLPQILQATPSNPVSINGDTGISSGMKSAMESIVGQPRILLLHNSVSGQGNNTYFDIVGFAPITVMHVQLTGGNKAIRIQPRVIVERSDTGGGGIDVDITPGGTINPLFLGVRSLVR